MVIALLMANLTLGPLEGFGRFGRIHQDGLLTLNVTPSSCTTVGPGKNWGLSWPTPEAPPTVASIDGTQKRLAFAPAPGGPSGIEYTLLYPGMALIAGTVLELTPSEGEFTTEAVLGRECQGMLIRRTDADAPPLLVATRWRGEPIRFGWNGRRLRLESDEPIGRVRIVTPTGIEPIPATSEAVRKWVDRPIPRMQSVRRTANAEIYQSTGPFTPVSPIFSQFPEATWTRNLERGPLTRLGDFLMADGSTVQVPLATIPMAHRGYFRPEKTPPEYTKLITELLGDFENTWATNAVDLGYSRRGPAMLAGSILPQETRAQVIAAMKRDLPRALGASPPTWQTETEPFTNQSYAFTYALKGPGGFRYDIEWGNLLPVYGLEQYAVASGDWGLVRQLWPGVRAAMRYVEISQDWAWMCNVNGDHGFSTGTGDALNAGYVGLVAATRLARALGESEDAQRWDWLARRSSIATRARLRLTPFAEKHGLVAPNRIVLGFHETEHFTRTPLDGDPWYPVTLLSGNGAFPELMHLYQRDRIGLTETLDRLERAYPSWMDGKHTYAFKGTYDGNSCYVTMPHLYARLLSQNPPAPEQAWAWVAKMATNRTHSWVSPNVLAELIGDGEALHLTEWGQAALLDSTRSGDRAMLTLRLPKNKATPLAFGGRDRVRSIRLGSQTMEPTSGRFVLPAGPSRVVSLELSVEPQPRLANLLGVADGTVFVQVLSSEVFGFVHRDLQSFLGFLLKLAQKACCLLGQVTCHFLGFIQGFGALFA